METFSFREQLVTFLHFKMLRKRIKKKEILYVPTNRRKIRPRSIVLHVYQRKTKWKISTHASTRICFICRWWRWVGEVTINHSKGTKSAFGRFQPSLNVPNNIEISVFFTYPFSVRGKGKLIAIWKRSNSMNSFVSGGFS